MVTELFKSSAYNGERLPARVSMADEVEQKLDAPKIQQPSDAAKQDGVIAGQPNQEVHGKAFATAHKDDKYPSGIMPALHESFGIEGDLTAADTGKKPADSRIAIRDDYLDRTEYKPVSERKGDALKEWRISQEKAMPRDGQELNLKQLLNDYKTPFIDAYERSKHLRDGEPGKSKTLEAIVDRLKACPWADKIRIKFDSHVENPEYNPVKSTITIKPQQTEAEQIELFVHEGFHATHQGLKELYMGGKPLDAEQYAELLGGLEARTFEAEIRVHNELTAAMGAKPVTYKWRDAHDHKQPDKDLGVLYAREGLPGLTKFILDEAYTDMKINGKPQSSNYRRYYESTQPTYLADWTEAHAELESRFSQDSILRSKIEQGGY